MDDLKKLHLRINALIDHRNRKMIMIDSARTPYKQFVSYRRLFLNEFGRNGLKADIADLFFEILLALAKNEPEDDAEQGSAE